MNIEDFLKIYREALLFLVLAIVLIIMCVKQVHPKITDFMTNKADIEQKKIAIEQVTSQLNAAKQQMERLKQVQKDESAISKTILQPRSLSLDNEAGYSVLFNDIFDMAKKNNIKTYSIQYEYDPADDAFVVAKKGYNVCLLKMKIIGGYTDFESFLTDLYKYPYLLSISSYDVVPYYKDKNVLLIKLGIKVYLKGDSVDMSEVGGEAPEPAPAPPAMPTPTPAI